MFSLNALELKIIFYVGTVSAIIVGGFIWLNVHDAKIRDKALSNFNIRQEEIYQKSQIQYQKNMDSLSQLNQQILSEIQIQKDLINAHDKKIEAKIKSQKGYDNNSSPFLKDFFKQLETK